MRKYLNEIIGYVIISIAAFAILGWIGHFDDLSRWIPSGITMKPWSAICLILASINCIFRSMEERSEDDKAFTGVAWTSAVWLCILQIGILCAALLYYITDHKNVWGAGVWNFGNAADAFKASFVTVLCLLIYGYADIFKDERLGWVLIGVGASIIFGWVFGFPLMYFQAEYYNGITAVALNSGVCLTLLGGSLLNRNKGCVPVG